MDYDDAGAVFRLFDFDKSESIDEVLPPGCTQSHTACSRDIAYSHCTTVPRWSYSQLYPILVYRPRKSMTSSTSWTWMGELGQQPVIAESAAQERCRERS